MLKTVNVFICLTGAVHITVATACYWFGNPPKSCPLNVQQGGKANYLTFWANVSSAFYFWLALINYLVSGCKDDKDQLLKKIKDYMFFTVVFPLVTGVSFMFWGLFAVDRDLIFPEKYELCVPSWLNHSLHSAIFLYAFLELLTAYHKPSLKIYHLLGVAMIFGGYAVWLHIIYFTTGCWIYFVLEKLPWFERELLTAFAALIAYGAFFLGLWLNNIIWKNRVQEKAYEVRSTS